MEKLAIYNNKQQQIMVSLTLISVVENDCFARTLILCREKYTNAVL